MKKVVKKQRDYRWLVHEKNGVFEINRHNDGFFLEGVIDEAIFKAKEENRLIKFCLVGVTASVLADSDSKLLRRDFWRAMKYFIDRSSVGPYPKARLTRSEIKHDALMEEEGTLESRERRREGFGGCDGTEQSYRANNKLDQALRFDAKNQKEWEEYKNETGYYWCRYMEYWARIMQYEMEDNMKPLAEIALSASDEACSVVSVSGRVFVSAVAALSKYWKHGEELRRWYNLHVQHGNEGKKANESGSVLNPNVLNAR